MATPDDYVAWKIKAAENVFNEVLHILQNQPCIDSAKNNKEISLLFEQAEKKYFPPLTNMENSHEADKNFRRLIKGQHRNQEDRLAYHFLRDFICRDITYFQYPIKFIKRESPDFIVEDRSKKIAIECTQIISKFHAEKFIPYQSALVDAFLQKQPQPAKAKFGISEKEVKAERWIPDSPIRVFVFENHFIDEELISKARRILGDKQKKAISYRQNAQFNKLFLLVFANGMSEATMRRVENAVKPVVNNAFDGIAWICLTKKDQIEVYAPYDELV